MTNKNVRLIDIAREVGYTVNTVSRALRDKDDIGFETKARIKEVAEYLGYVPNSIASSLRSGLSYTVAIVFDNMINPYFMIMADKLHQRLEKLGYATMIFAVYNNKFIVDSLNPIISRKVDGIITFLEPYPEVVSICKKHNIPLILLGRKNTQLDIDTISTDDYSGGFKVGKLLIEKGARNVGYLGAPIAIECSVRRLMGLKDAYIKHKLKLNEENFRYMTDKTIGEELDVMIKNNVDAIFFFNDVMALEGIKYLTEKNIKIPEDIIIVGFDNIESDFLIPISLTTVSTDKNLIADSTVEIIYKKMKGQSDINKINNFDFDVDIKIGSTI